MRGTLVHAAALLLPPAFAQVPEFLFEPLPSHPRCHAVSAVEMADGSFFAVWLAGRKEGSLDQAVFGSRRDPKTGAWSTPRIVFDTPDVPDYNPVLLHGGSALHLFVCRSFPGRDAGSTLWHLTSADGGGTWSAPARVLEGTGFWGRNAPVHAGGRWIVPLSDVGNRAARFLLSGDLKSFRLSPPVKDERYLTQPAVASTGGRRLVAVFRERARPTGRVWLAESDDLGDTWGPPRLLDFPNPDSGIALLSLPGRRLLLVYNRSERRRTPLNTAVSGDGGRSWRSGPVLESAPGEYSYPTAFLGSDGKIHIFYTWMRTHIRHVALAPSALAAAP